MAKQMKNRTVYTSPPLLFLAALTTNRARDDMKSLPQIQTKATHPHVPSLHILCKHLGRTGKGSNQRKKQDPTPSPQSIKTLQDRKGSALGFSCPSVASSI
jgi:hypothetical protein